MPENPKPRTPRQKTTANQPPQEKFCHVHKEVSEGKNYIRKNVCVPESEYAFAQFEGKYYCLFHLPTKEKNIDEFLEKFNARLVRIDVQCTELETEFPDDVTKQKEAMSERNIKYDFRYVWFPTNISLYERKFRADANFIATTFSEDVSFRSAYFSASVYFNYASFCKDAVFISTNFSEDATFLAVTFSANADFRAASFGIKSQVFFVQTKFFKNLYFNYAVFKGYVAFEGKKENRLFTERKSLLDLQNARIGEAKEISFHTVRLEPSWFVNTDASEFVFTDCEWYYVDRKPLDVKRELQNLNEREFENPNALLTKACWQLADNHEESKSFAKSSLFRQFAHESRRLETPWYFQPFTLHWWYYAFSFYGERWTRAFVMLVLILLLCGAFYNSPFAYFESSEKKNTIKTEDPKPKEYYKMNNFEGIIHSLNVAALQRPEPKPAPDSDLTKAVVILETIFAPLQAALLALAIRRKFMR